MKPQETAPLITAIAPAAAIAPPLAILGVFVGIGLLWLLSEEDKPGKPKASPDEASRSTSKPPTTTKQVSREDLAEALAYGGSPLTRKQAVAALEALGFRKTAAYKALSPSGKFGSLIETTPDGLIEWKG